MFCGPFLEGLLHNQGFPLGAGEPIGRVWNDAKGGIHTKRPLDSAIQNLVIAIMFTSITVAFFLSLLFKACRATGQQYYHVIENVTRVPITLGVMSRCPDALLCEAVLDTAFQKVWPLISLDLTFIAK